MRVYFFNKEYRMKKFVCTIALLAGILVPEFAYAGVVGRVAKAPVKVASKVAGVAVVPARAVGRVVKAKVVRKALRKVCGCRSCGC